MGTRLGHEVEEESLKNCLSTIGLGIAVFAFFGFQPAVAGCQLIHATHSARSQAKAVETSRALALRSAYDLKRAMGWSRIGSLEFCRSGSIPSTTGQGTLPLRPKRANLELELDFHLVAATAPEGHFS